jgi:hypothetical protein
MPGGARQSNLTGSQSENPAIESRSSRRTARSEVCEAKDGPAPVATDASEASGAHAPFG